MFLRKVRISSEPQNEASELQLSQWCKAPPIMGENRLQMLGFAAEASTCLVVLPELEFSSPQ